jgi:hypothetical protein
VGSAVHSRAIWMTLLVPLISVVSGCGGTITLPSNSALSAAVSSSSLTFGPLPLGASESAQAVVLSNSGEEQVRRVLQSPVNVPMIFLRELAVQSPLVFAQLPPVLPLQT